MKKFHEGGILNSKVRQMTRMRTIIEKVIFSIFSFYMPDQLMFDMTRYQKLLFDGFEV